MITSKELLDGTILLIDKPLYWTSFDVVNKMRWLIKKHLNIPKIKIGHAGTLDPLASGLLVICTGKKTKEIEKIQVTDKEYIATIEFGHTTPSYDLETSFNASYSYEHVTQTMIYQIIQKYFIGEIEQIPPLFSAKQINGRRAYNIARNGKNVELPAQKVHIYTNEIIKFQLPELCLKIICSKGTYIRSLAHDLGVKCNCGSYLKALIRTRSGNYELKNAISLQHFEQLLLTLQPQT